MLVLPSFASLIAVFQVVLSSSALNFLFQACEKKLSVMIMTVSPSKCLLEISPKRTASKKLQNANLPKLSCAVEIDSCPHFVIGSLLVPLEILQIHLDSVSEIGIVPKEILMIAESS